MRGRAEGQKDRQGQRQMFGHLMFLLQQPAPHALLLLCQGQNDLRLVNHHSTLLWYKVTEQGVVKAILGPSCSAPEQFTHTAYDRILYMK